MQAQFIDPSEDSFKLSLSADLSADDGSIDATHNLFANKMKMLAQVCKSDNAFAYIAAEHSYLLHGKQDYVKQQNFLELSCLLGTRAHTVQWVQDCQNTLAAQNDLALIALVAYNHREQVVGFLGTYVRNDSPQKEVIATQPATVLTLIAKDFDDEIKLNQSINLLKQKQVSYGQMAELNQDLICVKDESHRIVYANQAMLKHFDTTRADQIIGQSPHQLFDPQTSAQMINADINALENGMHNQTQQIQFSADQQGIFNTTQKRFVGVDGKTYLMSVSRDVTEKEILINDLKRSNEDLDNFAYVASHDLRSPLNVIKRLVTWVKEDCDKILPLDSKENLELVLNRTMRMEKLLVDLLNYSRIGKDYQESSIVNLRDLVVELLSLIDLPMGFVVNCADIDIQVATVPFNVVMLNLLSNAIKHHDSGNAKIEIKAKNGASGSVITIQDNGPGIAPKDRDRIFKLFETLKPRDEVEGSGMGLSVVKKIVEHYGGNIKVESNQPRGTKFIINWPIKNFARAVLDNLND